LAILFAAPYLVQYPGYVTEQYRSSIGMLDKAATMGQTGDWPHLFSLASLVGVEIGAPWQTVLRAAAALATLGLSWRVRRCSSSSDNCRDVARRELKVENCKLKIENSAPETDSAFPCDHASTARSEIPDPKFEINIQQLLTLYALATVYLLLFNPRTENNSYLLLSPVMAVFCVRALFIEGQTLKAALLFAGAIAIFAGHEICRSLTPQIGFIWISPLVCLLFSANLVRDVLWQAATIPTPMANPP
jgi:hypothetical protein